MVNVVKVDLLALATNLTYLSSLTANTHVSLLAYDSRFAASVLGPDASARQLYDLPWQAFHEMGTYHKHSNAVYITSNFVSLQNPINVTILSLDDYSLSSTRYDGLYEANGGTGYFPPGSDAATPPKLIFCDEGDFEHASALTVVDPSTNESEVILNSFLGRNFSSVNDVRQHPETGHLWFTDADYGWFQHFRPAPVIPKQVYRFEPATGVLQVVADGFVESNGLEFSPDLKTLYVSDTGAGQFSTNLTGPGTIYAFDVVAKKRLANRRTFAFADAGTPDGIHTDLDGNVWASCGDGVHIWDPEGILLGKIHLGVASNNLAFLPGAVLVFSNYQLWIIENIKAVGREICRDFGVC